MSAAASAEGAPTTCAVAPAGFVSGPSRLNTVRIFSSTRAGWAYFVSFQQAAQDFADLSRTKLTMPVMTIGGEKSLGEALGQQVRLVADNVTVVVIKNAGHWVLEEQAQQTTQALQDFL